VKSTYDIDENGIVDNSEKLEGSSKAQVQDHIPKIHALSAHTAASSDVNMGGKKITTLLDPVADQDIATKKYADDLLGTVTPADIPLLAYPWHPSSNEATMRSQYATLLSLGINAFEGGWGNWAIENWNKGIGVEIYMDRVYNIAEEVGLKVYWYTSMHRLTWTNPDTDPPNQTFVGRYKNFPACAGWDYCDEPALKNVDHAYAKWAIDWIHSQDPNHPVMPVWSADLETARYMFTMHPAWGDLYDISCTDIYPHARAGANWATFLRDKCGLTYYYTKSSPYWGFAHWQPRNHIAVIQAFEAGSTVDIVGQYNVLKDGLGGWPGWGDKLQGIAFYQAPLFSSGSFADMIREQIKDLARLRGWGG
ncbi:hypothetical protein LCGC14_2094200, partial [marine sediment metagenome]